MSRTIPYTHAGGTEQVVMYDRPAPTQEPPRHNENVHLSHHIEPPDHVDARGWAGAAAIGGVLFAVPVALIALYDGATAGNWIDGGRGFFKALLIPGLLYLAPLAVRFVLRYRFDTRTREAMPAPRPYVKPTGVIKARRIEPEIDPIQALHAKKLLALVLWATSVEYDERGNVIKEYGKAPAFSRDPGYKGRRELPVEGTGHIIKQEEQRRLNEELAAVGIFAKHPHPVGWGLADMTWTRKDALEQMRTALP